MGEICITQYKSSVLQRIACDGPLTIPFLGVFKILNLQIQEISWERGE